MTEASTPNCLTQAGQLPRSRWTRFCMIGQVAYVNITFLKADFPPNGR